MPLVSRSPLLLAFATSTLCAAVAPEEGASPNMDALKADDMCPEGSPSCGVELLQNSAGPRIPSSWRRLVDPNAEAQEPLVPALVNEIYTYGAPATHSQPFRNNAEADGCFPGLRSYTEDIVGAFDEIKQIDAAAIFNRYLHAYTSSLVLRKGQDSIYTPCSSAREGATGGHPEWPQTGAQVYQEWRLHQEDDYAERFVALTLDGKNATAQEPFASAAKFTTATWKNYDTKKNFQSAITSTLPGWEFVGRLDLTEGDDKDAVSVIQDGKSLECAVIFEGTNSVSELSTSTVDYGTGYCGFENVHVGYRNELWTLTGDKWQETIKPKLEQCSKVTCLGHSLGGSLCEIFTACANSGHYKDPDYKRLAWTPASQPRRLTPVDV